MKNTYVLLALLGLVTFTSAQQAQAFGPCQARMPEAISYIPKMKACGGKAAVVVSGKYYNAFSIVVRDCANGDRDPCHRHEGSCGTNTSSPFKVQMTINGTVEREDGSQVRANVHCLKEAGDSRVYTLVRRITIKLRNPVSSPKDLLKICLPNRVRPIHAVKLVRIFSKRRASNWGWTEVCLTQGYLDCPYDKTGLCNGR